jgi:branched-chain amino acid transport system permease protein
MFLTFPIMVIRVNTVENIVEWRWERMFLVGLGSFFLSFVWRYMLKRKESGQKEADLSEVDSIPWNRRIAREPRFYIPALIGVCVFVLAFPFIFSLYQTNIMITALIYVITGLGLNIVVGLAGLLDLGYVAFYAVGAYSYALLNYHFGLGFWAALPVGAGLGLIFGILLGFPVLRLKGDYLAIVTLGFGEIIRLVLENWNEFSFGPSGIANIPRPGLFGIEMSTKWPARPWGSTKPGPS